MLKMLIVEDERLEREGLVEFLDWNSLGIEIIGAACDGIEGIEFSLRLRPDIIITDIKMPGMHGIEMSKKIKEFLPEAKIIILTGYDDFKFAKEAINFKANAYVLKPVEEEELLSVIMKAAQESRIERDRNEQIGHIRNQLIDTYSTAKTKLLMDIIEGRVENERIGDYLKEYDIILNSSETFTIFVIKLLEVENEQVISEHYKDRKTMLKAICSGIEEFLGKDNEMLNLEAFFALADDIRNEIILCMPILQNDDTLLNIILHDVKTLIVDTYDLNPNIGVGRTVKGIWDVKLSYHDAKDALDFGEFWSVSDIIYYKEVENIRKDFNEKIGDFIINGNHLVKNLIVSVSSADEEKVFVFLEEMFQYINLYKSLDKEYVSNYLYTIINEISLFIFNINKRTENFMEDYSDCGRQFMHLKSLREMEQYLYKFLSKVLGFLNDKKINKDDNIIRKVLKIIEEKYMKEISLKTMAAEVFLSPNYLGNLFKKSTGKTFNEYLSEYRLEKAKELLKQGDKKVSMVAQEIGIPNTSYFCVLFKNAYGIAPGEFQEMTLRG